MASIKNLPNHNAAHFLPMDWMCGFLWDYCSFHWSPNSLCLLINLGCYQVYVSQKSQTWIWTFLSSVTALQHCSDWIGWSFVNVFESPLKLVPGLPACDINNPGNLGLDSSIPFSKQEFGVGESTVVCNISRGTQGQNSFYEGQDWGNHGCSVAPSHHVNNKERRKHWPVPPSQWCSAGQWWDWLPAAVHEAQIPLGKITFMGWALSWVRWEVGSPP